MTDALPHATAPPSDPPPCVLPRGVEISLVVERNHTRGLTRGMITCFRCGEQGHFKSECMTWKTKLCYNHMYGNCRDTASCSYAHSDEELRLPWVPKCVRVMKRLGRLEYLGCGEVGHTYRNCPRRQSGLGPACVLARGRKLEEYAQDDRYTQSRPREWASSP